MGVGVSGLVAPNQVDACAAAAVTQPLVKRVLSFIAEATPNSLTGTRGNDRAIRTNTFTQTFHFQLLQPGHHQTQTFIIGKQAMTHHGKFRRVPIRQKRKRQGQILFRLGADHMAVHFVSTAQERLKNVRAQSNHQGQTDCAPNRETTAYPRPDRETVFFRQIHFLTGTFLGAYEKHVAGPFFLCTDAGFFIPLIDKLRIEHRLTSRKTLTGNDGKSGFRVEHTENTIGEHPINRRQKMQPNRRINVS